MLPQVLGNLWGCLSKKVDGPQAMEFHWCPALLKMVRRISGTLYPRNFRLLDDVIETHARL